MAQGSGRTDFAIRLWRERKLMELRLGRDVENIEIAAALDVEASTVGRWFNGRTIPADEDLDRLVDYFSPSKGLLRYGEGASELPALPVTPRESREHEAHPPTRLSATDARQDTRAGGRRRRR